jgi:hypothetical protein
VACLFIHNFYTLFHKGHNLIKNVIEHKIRVLIFCTTLTETFLVIRRSERDMTKSGYLSSSKVPVSSCQVIMGPNFVVIFSKNIQIPKFIKNPARGIRVVPCGRTDWGLRERYDEAIICFS